MERAEDTSGGVVPTEGAEGKPRFSPVKLFLIFAVPIAALLVYLLATRAPEPPPQEVGNQEPGFALTDAEAIAKFKELHALLVRSYHEGDVSLYRLYAAPDATAKLREIREEIEFLNKNNISDRTRFIVKSVTVESNQPEEVVIRQILETYPRFINRSGERVDVDSPPQRLTELWTLRLYDSEWKLFRGRVMVHIELSRE